MKRLLRLITSAVVFFLAAVTPSLADQSCVALLNDLRNHLVRGKVRVHHATNYLTAQQSFGGWTQCWLDRAPANGFAGGCNRYILRESPALNGTFSSQPEQMIYNISADAKIKFGKYGPYEMSCIGDKFAVVNTWDSIETMVFIRMP